MTTLVLSTRPPCDAKLERWASTSGLAGRPFNHGFAMKDLRDAQLQRRERLRVLTFSTELGSGRRRFRKARQQLVEWRMHEGSTQSGIWTNGDALCTWAKFMLPGLWVVNPCRTLTLPSTRSSASVGYATCQGHMIAGSEHMSVRLRKDGTVHFEIISASRGAGPLGKIIFPMLAPAQTRFFREQLRCMKRRIE